MTAIVAERGEVERVFDLFGTRVRILIGVPRTERCPAPELAALMLERRFRSLHQCLTRFDPESELSRLNRAPERTVPISLAMTRFLSAAEWAAQFSDGLVDATRIEALEKSGYDFSLSGVTPTDLDDALAAAPRRMRAAARRVSSWRDVHVDVDGQTVSRPPELRFDSGGLGKGLAADLGAAALAEFSSFAIDCGGDMRIGGVDELPREVEVDDPFTGCPTMSFSLRSGAVATSGLNRRIWARGGGFAHHLIDPSTDSPAWTGLVQATAVAPTGVEAETRAKAALLSGPEGAGGWLSRWGGVVFADDGAPEAFGPLDHRPEPTTAAP
jgi:thiamine biosynthesis lipoprotein